MVGLKPLILLILLEPNDSLLGTIGVIGMAWLSGTGADHREATMVVAAYARIAEDLRGKITSRVIRPGGQLPSELELRDQYKASSNTVLDAIKKLKDEGLIETRPRAAFTPATGTGSKARGQLRRTSGLRLVPAR
jgi:hypothetical protein